ncbi:hypothetical protein HY638_00775 [Candidatus Woesearchaeota archaeon]|nr:hypothetical protein [Candidatus Woesearchaeota archaeon]
MSKKKYIKGAESLMKQIEIHRNIKLEDAKKDGNAELERYYEKEIRRLEEQLAEKDVKLLTRNERIRAKKLRK